MCQDIDSKRFGMFSDSAWVDEDRFGLYLDWIVGGRSVFWIGQVRYESACFKGRRDRVESDRLVSRAGGKWFGLFFWFEKVRYVF